MNRWHVLLVGGMNRTEFRPIKPSLCSVAIVEEAEDLRKGCRLLEKGDFLPDLLLLLQSYPREFSAEQLDAFRRLAPLASVGVVLGPWCEGEGRSGKPLPGTWRMYWHQWSGRWGRQWERWFQGECPLWGWPTTAIEEDYLLAAPVPPAQSRSDRIGLWSLQPQSADWLFTALKDWGFDPQWIRFDAGQQASNILGTEPRNFHRSKSGKMPLPEEVFRRQDSSQLSKLNAVVFDGTDAEGMEAVWLRQLATRMPESNILLLVDFPRPELWERVRPWGVKAILGKPIALGDLVWHLDQLENKET
ncbi:MAG TPA: hypothetical protein PLQ00_10895 [Thermoguttaceae bacterium]|nr:hypothetical protein [Thermoguttaceae bacterium]